MFKELGLKEKDSLFHRYVYQHIKIGQNSEHPSHSRYMSKYREWKVQFNYCHGDLDTQRKINVPKIAATFNVKLADKEDVFKFIFSVDAFYISFLTLCAAKKLDQNYSKKKFSKYINLAYFRGEEIGNYFTPSNIYQGLDCEHVLDCLVLLAAKIDKLDLAKSKSVDLIREVFHGLYPKEVRHGLGEFYTPDWMAQHIVKFNSENLDKGVILDPTCGSGTFLLAALNQAKLKNANFEGMKKLLGFDINPVSVFAAKTNLILNLKRDEVLGATLPIFNANILDYELNSMAEINSYDDALTAIKKITTVQKKAYSENDVLQLEEISLQVPRLSKECVSLAVGNPPWVNWEYLPSEYKDKYKIIWQKYGLFDYKGMVSTFIKEDISSLITYVTINHYLRDQGHISFVVKESLFKSIKQAAGFRKFKVKSSNTKFKVTLLEDLTAFNPFKGISNNTVIFHATKGEETLYPVQYKVWALKPKSKFQDTDNIAAMSELVLFDYKLATPSNPIDQTSGWASLNQETYKNMALLTGQSAYRARTGVFTGGANGIYWLDIIKKSGLTRATVENKIERAKIKFEKVNVEIENDMLYPYASGSDIKMWSYTYKKYIVCPHTANTKMYPIAYDIIEEKFPLAADYFNFFKEGLKARRGFTSFDRKIHDAHFYTLQRIGKYTFAKYKVAWKYIASDFTCAVIQDIEDKYLGKKTIIPNEKIIYIGLDDKSEAYFLCGILSSTYFRNLINSFKVSTQIAPSTIKNLNIPKYDPSNSFHTLISSLCEKGHEDVENIKSYISEIDELLLDAISPVCYKNKVAIPAAIGVQAEFGF